jgi:hypothetical protein
MSNANPLISTKRMGEGSYGTNTRQAPEQAEWFRLLTEKKKR